MRIYGIEKLSLLDYPGKLACTLWTAQCNFRCPFCHNAPLVTGVLPDPIDNDEIVAYLKKRQGVLEGVCVTGGEPTINGDLPDFLASLKELGYAVKLDTNGTNPKMLSDIVNRGLVDYIAMDIKNSPAKYAETCGVSVKLDNIYQSIDIVKSAKAYEFRTTLVAELHTLDDARAIGAMVGECTAFYLQKYVDRDTCIEQGMTEVQEDVAATFADVIKQSTRGIVELRGY